VVVDPEKIKAIMVWSAPQNVKKIKYFMGLVKCYRRFIKEFSNIFYPITSLQRKGKKFIWSTKCEANFQQLKHLLTNATILKIEDIENVFLVCTDA
jgi:hypothetical protein